MKFYILFFISILSYFSMFSQQEDERVVYNDSIAKLVAYEASLRPAKAGFYSAVVPGLGHLKDKYNYIKIPVIYGALGTTTYYYIKNNKNYEYFRQIFRDKKLDASLYPEYSIDFLERAQKGYKKQRDLSMLLIVGTYLVQIVWASVDAHLKYHNTNKELSFSPQIFQEPISGKNTYGVGLSFNF